MKNWVSMIVVSLSFLLVASASNAFASVSEFGIRQVVQEAQDYFEIGKIRYQRGETESAVVYLTTCRDMLLKADHDGGEAFKRRMEMVFHLFYGELAELDPKVADEFRAIGKQINETYGNGPAVYEGQVEYHMNFLLQYRRDFLKNSFNRSLKYIPMIQDEFRKAGIPEDLAFMALIESGFRPDPTSKAGAKGLWQFMPVTAKRFGLRVDDALDERLDPYKSTVAAAKYLKVLHAEFGDWPLAVAAYNCGEGRVRRTLKKKNATTFWELVELEALPVETQRYVPSIIAATIISRDMPGYGL